MSRSDNEIESLRAETIRLKALLSKHGIDWQLLAVAPSALVPMVPAPVPHRQLSTDEKIALFRRLFQGRSDTFPVRWVSKKSGQSGYGPACANEWVPGVCEKPRIKCSDCNQRALIALSDTTIFEHLTGKKTAGVYPLLLDDHCHFLAVDFDGEEWRDDVSAFVHSCDSLGVPASTEISRSGDGAHVWIFFGHKVSATEARRLGTALISHTCARTRQLKLGSYDRLFPNQDVMPKGGFGNLIALPLQKEPRERQRTVFVNRTWTPYPDQWAYLSSIETMAPRDIEPTILRATGGVHPLDVTFIEEEDLKEPWKRQLHYKDRLSGTMPVTLSLVVSNLIYIEKTALPQSLANRLIRLAAFQNPAFYKAQAMRLSVWDKARVIGCAENYPNHIALPRGCIEAVRILLTDNGIRFELKDETVRGQVFEESFKGQLRIDQEAAVTAMLGFDTGVLCAPTAFGKTVVAAAMIARRGVNTLILVHRTELLRQWQERLKVFLGVGKEVVGTIGGGKSKRTGMIDIAVMQSLSREDEIDPLVEEYGQVIVDECHHIGASSFEEILKSVKATFVLGLTATPFRRDGLQPIIFMQCGPIRHKALNPAGAPQDLLIVPRFRAQPIALATDGGIQDIFRMLASDQARTDEITADIVAAFDEGRKVLVLTERTEHLEALQASLILQGNIPFVLHGRMSKKLRINLLAELEALAPDAPRILLSTGKLVGEGFDHPPLDTLVLAMPVSWKGTLQQYAGRLHREHANKSDVRIIDIVDMGHPMLQRMWAKRQVGYRAMGYRLEGSSLI